jgi:predicted kinase
LGYLGSAVLIIFAGLPGTGKTTLATEIARRIEATYLRIDSIEQAMTNSSLKIHPIGDAGYMAGYALAEDNLRIGGTVVADSVNPWEISRTYWLDVAERTSHDAVEIEVVCSDPIEHQLRIETRKTNIPGLKLPTWQDVLDRDYHPWNRDHVVIDTAGKTVEQSIDELMASLPS